MENVLRKIGFSEMHLLNSLVTLFIFIWLKKITVVYIIQCFYYNLCLNENRKKIIKACFSMQYIKKWHTLIFWTMFNKHIEEKKTDTINLQQILGV